MDSICVRVCPIRMWSSAAITIAVTHTAIQENSTTSITNVLVASRESGCHTIADLVTAAKAKPASLTFTSAGIGSTSHLAAERFRLAATSTSDQHQAFAKTTTPFAGITIEADALNPCIGRLLAWTPVPLPATCGFTQWS